MRQAEVDEDLGNFADRIRDAFKNGDWDGLGKILADKFNEVMDGIDWSGIGSKIGRGINGAIKTAYSFLSNADFRKLGNHVADLLNNALRISSPRSVIRSARPISTSKTVLWRGRVM